MNRLSAATLWGQKEFALPSWLGWFAALVFWVVWLLVWVWWAVFWVLLLGGGYSHTPGAWPTSLDWPVGPLHVFLTTFEWLSVVLCAHWESAWLFRLVGGVGCGVFGPLAYSQCAPAVDISLFSLLETDSNWHFAGPFCLAFPRRFGVCVVVWFVGLLLFGLLFLWRR